MFAWILLFALLIGFFILWYNNDQLTLRHYFRTFINVTDESLCLPFNIGMSTQDYVKSLPVPDLDDADSKSSTKLWKYLLGLQILYQLDGSAPEGFTIIHEWSYAGESIIRLCKDKNNKMFLLCKGAITKQEYNQLTRWEQVAITNYSITNTKTQTLVNAGMNHVLSTAAPDLWTVVQQAHPSELYGAGVSFGGAIISILSVQCPIPFHFLSVAAPRSGNYFTPIPVTSTFLDCRNPLDVVPEMILPITTINHINYVYKHRSDTPNGNVLLQLTIFNYNCAQRNHDSVAYLFNWPNAEAIEQQPNPQ